MRLSRRPRTCVRLFVAAVTQRFAQWYSSVKDVTARVEEIKVRVSVLVALLPHSIL